MPDEVQDVIALSQLCLQGRQRAGLWQQIQRHVHASGDFLQRGPLLRDVNGDQIVITPQVVRTGDGDQDFDGALEDGAARLPSPGQVAGEWRSHGGGKVLRSSAVSRIPQELPGDGVQLRG